MSGSSPWSPAIPACDDRSTRPTSPARRRLIAAHDPDRSPQKGISLYAVRKLYRDPSRRLVAGVASGIAGHLGVPVYAVRVTFVALLPFDGLGALLYAVFWAVLSSAPGVPPKKRDKRQMLTYLALGLGVLLVQQMIGLGGGSNMFLGWLIAIIAIGAGIIWHLADPDRRRRWTSAVPNAPWLGAVVDETSRRSYLLRIVGGGACVIVGIIGISLVAAPHAGVGFTELLGGLLYALVALAGVALVIAPLLWRTFGQLRAERIGRIREQERAEIAAMVHDQVLHTLALIQRKAGEPKEVVRLARGQERTLRNWLYKPVASPTEKFSAAVEEVVAEVEDTYAVVVESVVVGDIDVTERVAALVAVAGEPSTVGKAVTAIAAVQPDVVLLDVHMPDGGGRAVLESVRKSHPQVKFLALSVSDAAEDVIGLIRAGARGYVTKTIAPEDLADAIRRVADGDAVFSPRLAGFVLDAFAARTDAPVADPELDQLTNREREVLRLLARGYAYKEIAKELYISIKTVETHVSNVLRKLQMSNRYELSRWAADRRLV